MVRIGYAGKPVSQATISKLKGATYTYGKTLREGGSGSAPDGGAIADYPKGWRFLPPATKEQHEILKKNPAVVYAMDRLHNLGGVRNDASGTSAGFKKIIADAHYNLVIAPQIKAEKEQKEREEGEQSQTIANLKMRVQELTKKPIEVSTAPAITKSPTSYLPLAVVGIVIVVILIILRRRA